MKNISKLAAVAALVVAALVIASYLPIGAPEWTTEEIRLLQTLSIVNLPPVPSDPSSAVADDPRAARFGQALFFDPRLSGTGTIACASCHQPENRFTDGLQKGQAIGSTDRNTVSIVGSAFSPWLYWDGRKDSLWSQALAPLEDPDEHGGNRMGYVRFIAGDPDYRASYESLFGPMPNFSNRGRFPEAAAPGTDPELAAAWNAMSVSDREAVNRVFANIGKSIAAYERLLLPGRSRFDAYIDTVIVGDTEMQQMIFSNDEAQGLRLFIGAARCLECHNGPLLTNNEFHNTGVLSAPGDAPDRGRLGGVAEVLDDPFNCRGAFSDDPEQRCPELEFVRSSGIELVGALRTPSLRNLAGSAPYHHRGQSGSIAEVLDRYKPRRTGDDRPQRSQAARAQRPRTKPDRGVPRHTGLAPGHTGRMARSTGRSLSLQ